MTRMDGDHWQSVRALFDELVDLDAGSRDRRLAILGESDPTMRQSVESLLRADAEVDERLASIERVLQPRSEEVSTRAIVDPLGLTGLPVAHFHVLEPIAVGGMGVVYRAEDTRLGRMVALKLPLPERLGPDTRERFLRECRAAAVLDHPNVCAIHEVGETDDGYLYLAMTLYPGETLAARLSRNEPLDVAEAITIARAIARGVGAAHAAGIVHRDVKPANVMLLPDGSVKVLDFGLARLRDVSATRSGAMMGTISYMAPEQIRGAAADARCDVWAIGVVLYEMLTGRRPFLGEREIAVAHAIVHDDPPSPGSQRPDIPDALDALALALLSKDPGRRPPSAVALEEALRAAEMGFAPPVRATALVKRRTRTVFSAGVLLALGGAAATAAYVWGSRPKIRASIDAEAYFNRGRDYELRPLTTENLRSAQDQYERALALDSSFARAHARLAITHAVMFAQGLDRSADRLARARAEARAASRGRPELPEAHVAQGYASMAAGDLNRALGEYDAALAAMPNNIEVLTAIADVLRLQGRWADAATRFERAAAIAPRDAGVLRALARTQSRLRRYADAVRSWDRVIALTPDDHDAKLTRAYVYMRLEGTIDTMVATLGRLPPDWDAEGAATWARYTVARIRRRPREALDILAASRRDTTYDDVYLRPRALLEGQAYADLDETARARERFEAARRQLEEILKTEPNSSRLRIPLGLAYAGLGRTQEALEEARRAIAAAFAGEGAETQTAALGGAAEIYTRAGDIGAAIPIIERLLAVPAGREVSIPLLRLDPVWDPLRGDARFQRLIAE